MPGTGIAAFGPEARRFYEHPAFDRVRARRARIALSVAYVLAAAAMPVAASLAGHFWPVFALLVPLTAIGATLDASIRGLTEVADARLDERERGLRARAFQVMYWPAVLFALWGGFEIAPLLDGDPATMGLLGTTQVVAVASFVTALLMQFPALYLAWSLPDDSPEPYEAYEDVDGE